MAIKNEPVWQSDARMPRFPGLKKSSEKNFDIVIIGGGITGITCAYLLSLTGKRVALLEKDTLSSGATGMTTAFLTQSIDTDLQKLVSMFGKEKTALIRRSHQYAIDQVEKIVSKNNIDCEFMRCSNYAYALNEKDAEYLKEEEKVARSLMISEIFKEGGLNFENSGYLEMPGQAKFHPLKYLSSLAKIAAKNGVKFYENTEVKDIEDDGFFYILKTGKGDVVASHVVMATYAPINKKLYFKKAFYTSYVIEAQIPKGILKEGIYEDTLDPYQYFRVDAKKRYDRIIIGGQDHRSDIPIKDTKNFRALSDYMRDRFPDIKFKIVRKWKGPIVEPVDGLAYIGKANDQEIYYATGFSGNGMTYGTLAGYLISHKILGGKDSLLNRFSEIYEADRILTPTQLVNKGADYTKEFIYGAIRNSLKYRKRTRIS